ncbi:MAG: transketolase, partial [Rhodospirillaceae bacterium]|nr:transketolase [Rhodospirillaceae bacterium]
GHGSMLLYSLLYLTGYPDMTLEQVMNFRQLGSITAGHPEYGHAAGVETTTGPLGQGIATAVGMALAERMLAARFGPDLVDHHTYVLLGDGCLMEGISQEALSLAGHLKLGKLICLYDDNHISIDGATSLTSSDDAMMRAQASGWHALAVDGHDPEAVADAITAAQANPRPSLICCRTTIGFGAPHKAGTAGVHGAPLGADEIAATREALGWPYPPFEVPEPILATWRGFGERGRAVREAWDARLAATAEATRAAWSACHARPSAADLAPTLEAFCTKAIADAPKWATRKASQEAIGAFAAAVPQLVGGSADLTGSNLTRFPEAQVINAGDFAGRYLHFGVREHGMAAALNGLTLHGGFIGYGGTFLCFTDYARPAIRLSALMGLGVVYVMTHDSIGQGEDGPTHQPIEHLASLRAMPNLLLMRPADAVETAECWAVALADGGRPAVLVLSRQNLPTLRSGPYGENLSARGAYVLAEAEGERAVTILATGSEVEIALAAKAKLAERGVAAAVVSMPCWELLEEQDEAYRAAVLGTAPRVAVEAASPFGWTRYVAREADVVGMPGFGASAPGPDLYQHFGITADAVADRAQAVIARG